MKKRRRKAHARRCAWCNKQFTANRAKQIYCCDAHRVAAYRKRREDAALPAKFDRLIALTNLGELRDRMKRR